MLDYIHDHMQGAENNCLRMARCVATNMKVVGDACLQQHVHLNHKPPRQRGNHAAIKPQGTCKSTCPIATPWLRLSS
jgi:hypothetical protein